VALLAFGLNYLALQNRDATVLVAVADRPLFAGTPLQAEDFRLVPVATSFSGLDSLLTEGEIASREGWFLSRAVAAGAVIDEAALVEPGAPSGLRAMSIPIEIEHAAGGSIAPGDRIDVISTSGTEAVFVVSGVRVIAVADRSSAVLGGVGAYHIVVGVDARQALALADAIAEGSIEVIESTGAPPVDEAETP
jgi:Flp pilus assembly protein CpaB